MTAHRPQSAAQESGHRQVTAVIKKQNSKVQKATNNVTDTAKPQSKKIQSLPVGQKSSQTIGIGSTTSSMTTKLAASRKLQHNVDTQPTPRNNEVTIARHKPTVSRNISISTRRDTEKNKNGGGTSRQAVKTQQQRRSHEIATTHAATDSTAEPRRHQLLDITTRM